MSDGGAQSWSGHCEEDKNLALPEIEPGSSNLLQLCPREQCDHWQTIARTAHVCNLVT
jgi:hypothetical protein